MKPNILREYSNSLLNSTLIWVYELRLRFRKQVTRNRPIQESKSCLELWITTRKMWIQHHAKGRDHIKCDLNINEKTPGWILLIRVGKSFTGQYELGNQRVKTFFVCTEIIYRMNLYLDFLYLLSFLLIMEFTKYIYNTTLTYILFCLCIFFIPRSQCETRSMNPHPMIPFIYPNK